tara:strand:+ start:207 stop:404 length:198 start_codon:yes stop_codon:yes gene_type:complete
MKELKKHKFLIILISITAFIMVWTDYDTKQTAKKIKESRIEIEEKLRLAKEKSQQKDSILIEKKK